MRGGACVQYWKFSVFPTNEEKSGQSIDDFVNLCFFNIRNEQGLFVLQQAVFMDVRETLGRGSEILQRYHLVAMATTYLEGIIVQFI